MKNSNNFCGKHFLSSCPLFKYNNPNKFYISLRMYRISTPAQLHLMSTSINMMGIIFFRSSHRCSFIKKGVFTGKQLCQSPFFNKVAGLRPATLLKKETLAKVYFPVNFAKFLRTPFFTEHLWTTASGFCSAVFF